MSDESENELLPIEALVVDLISDVRFIQGKIKELDSESSPEICILKSNAKKLMDEVMKVSEFISSIEDQGNSVDNIKIEVDEDGEYGNIILNK